MLLVTADDPYLNLQSIYPFIQRLGVPLLSNVQQFNQWGKLIFVMQMGQPAKTLWKTDVASTNNLEMQVAVWGKWKKYVL